jgi:hypothetical protein
MGQTAEFITCLAFLLGHNRILSDFLAFFDHVPFGASGLVQAVEVVADGTHASHQHQA